MPANVKELFLALLDIPADKRAAYLDTACAGDAALRNQVEAMLRCHANSGELLVRSLAEMLQDIATDADVSGADAPQADPAATLADSAQVQANELPFLTPSEKPGQLGQLGPYEVAKVLGKGGFGVVLKAFDGRLHRMVAIKVLSPAYAAIGSARKRFSREARAAAAVKNEHVVGIHDVQGDADPPYLVMEYIDGTSLQDKIDRHGSLALTEILRISMQIAEGLAAAHKQGLVHRDIKPANILLENGVERIKITDFGLARTVDDASVTQSGTVAGTPMYMSPEQADGLPIDHRSDLFSLGTVMYAICTGHPPFRATGTVAVLKRVVEDTPRPIREINSEIPDWLCDIIRKLHAKKPEDRFQTATEVAELLGRRLADVQAGRAISESMIGEPSRVSDRVEAPARPKLDAAGVLSFASGMGIFVMLLAAVMAILIPLLTASTWDDRSMFLAGILVLTGCTGVVWGLTVALKRTALRSWVQPLHYAAIAFCVLTIGSALAWLKHTLNPSPAVVELSFVHPTARVVLEGGRDGPREFQSEKPGHGNSFVDVPGGAYEVKIFVGDKLVATEQITLRAGQHIDIAIEPKGKLHVVNESDEPVTIYGLVEPGTPLPPDEKASPKMTREVIGPHSAVVDAKWAGFYRWVRGDDAGECFIMAGKSAVLAIPKKLEPGWVRLFNGKDLTGWHAHAAKGDLPIDPSTNWEVKDNLILGGPSHWSYLRTQKAYQNFTLTLDYRCPPGSPRGRAGIMLLGEGPDRIWPQSLQLDLAGLNGFNNVDQSSIKYDRFTPPSAGVGGDDWWPLKIVARDGTFEFFFKGISFGKVERLGSHQGFIGIFTDGRGIQLRNIQIQTLPPAEPGWTLLFNGRNLAGWKADKANWILKDGAIVADSPGQLVSEQAMPKDFHLRMEVMLKRGIGVVAFRRPSGDWVFDLMDNRLGMVECMMVSQGQLPHKATELVREVAKLNEWIVVDLIAKDQQARVEINGKHVAFLHDDNYKPAQGHIGLLIGNSAEPDAAEMHVRKIAIKELPPSPPESAFQLLFNGMDASAWDMERADNWKFDDNRLICRGSGGMLRPKKLGLREFHLRIEARHFGEGAYLRLGPQMFQTPDKKSVTAHQHVLLSPVLISAAGTIGMDFGGKDLTGGVAQKDRTKPGEWYTLDVIHEGRYVRTLINGEQAAEFVVTEPGALVGLGLLGFNQEDKNGELQIRKIEIKDLSADLNTTAKRLQGFWTPVEAIRGAVGIDAALSKADLKAVALEFDKDKLKCGLFPDAKFHLSAPNRITINYRGPAKQMVSAEATYRLTHDILALDFADIDLPFGPAAPKNKNGTKPLQLALFRYHAGLVPLFNGKNLDGFVNDREHWTWQGDTLIGTRRPNDMQDDLLFRPSMPNLRDFELEFQARTQGQAPVGILFRGGENKENVGLIANGPMLSIGDITPGGLWNRNRDQLLKIPPAEKIKAVKPDDFNHYVLRCMGKRVTVQINGVTMIDDDLDIPKMQPAGKLAWTLLDNGKAGTVTFREIRLRAL